MRGRRAQARDRGVGVGGAEDRGTGDEGVGARLGRLRDRRLADPAVDLQPDARPAAARLVGEPAELRHRLGHERLAAEARARPSSRGSGRSRRAGRTAPRRGWRASPRRPARAPIARSRRASATGSVAASRWKVTDAAPSSAYSGAQRSGSSIMRCTSSGTGLVAWIRSTICGPNVRFGTKWLSITSTWTKSAVAMRASSACMLTKSAARMLGLIRMPPWRPFSSRRGTRPLWSSRGLHHGAARRRARRGQTAHRRGARRVHPRARDGRSRPARARRRRPARTCAGPRATTRSEFTIQSMSKPFVLALALVERGRDAVLAKVGAEPSGEPFNAISLEEGTGRPANPMINAGRDRDDRRSSRATPSRTARGRHPRPALARSPAASSRSTSRCTPRSPPPATAIARSRICCARTT